MSAFCAIIKLFLRPSLMVLGFIIAMIVCYVALKIIIYNFPPHLKE